MARHSGLQLEVLALYRDLLRAAGRKQHAATNARESIVEQIRSEFRSSSRVPKTAFARIEHLFRKGKKSLEMLSQEQVRATSVFTVRGPSH